MSLPLSFTAALTFGLSMPWSDLYVDRNAVCAAGNGSAATPFCTVTEAINVANDGDRILVAAGVYDEVLVVDKDLTVIGAAGAAGATILSTSSSATVLRVAAGKTVTVEAVRLRDGDGLNARPSTVDNAGTLTLRNTTITGGGGHGIGVSTIYQRNGSGLLTLDHCTISGNYVNSSSGALLRAHYGGAVTIRDSWFHDNTQYWGPVIRGVASDFTIERTTFSANTSYAAATIQLSQCGLVMRNSTIANNAHSAIQTGSAGGTQLLENCTVFGNGAGYVLHGIQVTGPSPFRLKDTIVAGGHPVGQTHGTLSGPFLSLGHNLIDNATNSTGLIHGVLGDQVGSAAAPLAVGLAPLLSVNGQPPTRLPAAMSLALDAGNAFVALPLDQNGFPRLAHAADVGAAERPLGAPIVACVGLQNSTGQISRLQAAGALSVATNALRLLASEAPPGSLGIFLTSRTSSIPGSVPPGSQGRLCLGGAIGRFSAPGQPQVLSPTGMMGLDVDLHALPQPTGLISAMSGETWHFQAWFRDAVGGVATSNFSTTTSIQWN